MIGLEEVDAEGEEEYEDNGDDGEDKEIYCFCRRLSYGEVNGTISFVKLKVAEYVVMQMIACDNPDCTYQWVSVVYSSDDIVIFMCNFSFFLFFKFFKFLFRI